jgi:SSS family solute:Na+ symporter
MNQYVSQRLLGARDIRTAGWGAMLAATLKLLPLFLMVLPGVMAAALFTDLDRADTVFPRLVATYAPVGLAGLIIAGLMAAIMSSIDSALNSASTLITLDFVAPRRPGLDAKAQARLGRIITLSLVAVAALWAPMIDRFPGLFAYLQQGFAYVTPPLVAIFLLGLFNRAIGASAALYACATGHAVSAAWFAATQTGLLDVHFTVVAGILLLVTVVAALAWQRWLGAPPSDAQLEAVTAKRYAPLPVAVRRCAIAITLVVAAIVVAFW